MKNVSVSLDDTALERLEAIQERDGIENRSEAVRVALEEREQLAERVDELEGELSAARAERDDLRRQLAETNQRIETTNELVRKVDRQQTLEEKRAEAGIATRIRWWFSGMDRDELEE
jgi:metal-responsive CopG/Arc/MetJ family transcriptional regulator